MKLLSFLSVLLTVVTGMLIQYFRRKEMPVTMVNNSGYDFYPTTAVYLEIKPISHIPMHT